MPEEIPLSDSPAGGDAAAAPPPSPPVDEGALRDAQGRFRARAEKAGLDLGDVGDGGGEAVSTPPEGEHKLAAPVLDGDKANADYSASRAMRKQQAANERVARILEAFSRQAEHDSRTRPEVTPAPAAAGAAAEDPEPDREEDYWKWQEWRDRQTEKRLLSSLEEKLKPVLSFAEQQEQSRRQQEEERQLASQRDAWYQENRAYAQEAHEAYVATQEGKDYMDRILYHVGDFGDPGDPARGIPPRPPSDGVLSLGWQVAFPGMPPAVARELAQRHFHGFMSFAQRWNEQFPERAVNPAVALDRFTRVQLAGGAAYQSPGSNGNGHAVAPTEEVVEAEATVSPRIAALRAAKSSAGAVAGSAVESGGRGGELDLRALARGDRLGIEELRALAKKKYGNDSRANMQRIAQDLSREAERARKGG